MAGTFPGMTPSSRSMTMGDLPSKTYRAMSGATVRRAFGNKKTQYNLKLQFTNIGDDAPLRTDAGTVAQILSHYSAANGTFSSFDLGTAMFNGMGDETQKYFRGSQPQSPEVKWRYAKPPEVKSVYVGISNVSVELIGELDG